MPPRLRREGHGSGEDVPPQRFTRHHDQRRESDDEEANTSHAQELPYHTNTLDPDFDYGIFALTLSDEEGQG
jgi:hypothetical protein